MYDKRVKIFVTLSALLFVLCVLRLMQMQLLPDSSLQSEIEELKRQRGLSQQLKTIRGRILDRKGRILAVDEPGFHLFIEYSLSCFLDQRVRKAKLLKAARQDNADILLPKVQKELQDGLEDLQRIIDKCTHFGFSAEDIENKVKQINDKIWNRRRYLAWKRNYPTRDFVQAVLDANDRLLLTAKVDIVEMYKSWPLLELETDDAVFNAQLEFTDVNGVKIMAQGHRSYPYSSVAAQTIGWVGLATQPEDKELFEGDRLASYLEDEVCGREDGVEYVCETVLRGRRGEVVHDIDRQLISRTETQFGEDVQLTLDIEVQQRIENYLANYPHDPNCGPGMAAVVIDVATSDILALVSLPVLDLNRARYDYGTLIRDPNKPLINRAINKQYPPGSVVKPLILIAALETGKITADETERCLAQAAPFGWPSCWIYNRHESGHSNMWENNARNAIKGSCNIYFSRLADRIEPRVLQQWLFKFGYGHCFNLTSCLECDAENAIRNTQYAIRDFRQAPGQISTTPPETKISAFEQIPDLTKGERRLFGIGQGNLRATPLQVANAMAAIARHGVYKPPRLFLDSAAPSIDLNISPQTLEVIYDGMSAVVSEPGGTAYKEFAYSGLGEQGVKVYGKTGSTEEPDVAWFAGFAWQPQAQLGDGFPPGEGRAIAIAVVVEGGQHGSSNAAPLAREIIQFCIEYGYIGNPSTNTQ